MSDKTIMYMYTFAEAEFCKNRSEIHKTKLDT